MGAQATYCSSPKSDTLYLYPNTNNCSSFIACINHEEYEFDCFQAPLFGYPEKPLCPEKCAAQSTTRRTTKKSVKSKTIDLSLYPDTPARSIVCPSKGKTVARIMESCTQYMTCQTGIATKVNCSEGQEFSPKKLKCVAQDESECYPSKHKGTHHTKCRYNLSNKKLYFSSDRCDYFRRCDGGLAYEEKCAENTYWNPDSKSCEWGGATKCLEE
jgi:hypothetical protein